MVELSIRLNKMTWKAVQACDDEEWAGRIRGGGYASFEALFDAYYEELVRFAHYFVGRQDVAQDLVQDVFFNIWKTRANWCPRGALRTYLYGATRNQCLMYLKHQRVARRWEARAQQEESQEGHGPESDLQFEELDRVLQQAIEDLPERRRLIFTLSRQQELTYAEIAGLLGISINTVENQMVSALKFLRERLSDFLPKRQ